MATGVAQVDDGVSLSDWPEEPVLVPQRHTQQAAAWPADQQHQYGSHAAERLPESARHGLQMHKSPTGRLFVFLGVYRTCRGPADQLRESPAVGAEETQAVRQNTNAMRDFFPRQLRLIFGQLLSVRRSINSIPPSRFSPRLVLIAVRRGPALFSSCSTVTFRAVAQAELREHSSSRN